MLQQKGAAFISPVGNLNTKPDLKWKEDKSCWKWNRLKDEEKLKREIEAKKAHCSIIEEVVRKDWQGLHPLHFAFDSRYILYDFIFKLIFFLKVFYT
jgi:hypothetical protein